MNEIAIYSVGPAGYERLSAALGEAGFRTGPLPEDPAAAEASLRESAAQVVVIDSGTDMGRMSLLATAAGAAGKETIGIVAGADDCARIGAVRLSDFIVEPWPKQELAARVRRLLKRELGAGEIVIDDLVIMPDSYEVTIGGQPLKLTFKEYELLKYLAENSGRVLTRTALLKQIWEYDYYGGTRTVDVHVRRLRAKLGIRYGELIKTVRQVGYKFER
jgi:DNA-binding response OmpR family regulator